MQMLRDIGNKRLTAIVLIVFAAMVSHAVSIIVSLLLDEQFLYRWSMVPINSADWRPFLAFSGPGSAELWAPLTPVISQLLSLCSAGSPIVARLEGVGLHIAVAVMLFRLLLVVGGSKLGNRNSAPVALSSAVLFAVIPFGDGGVVWLGGRGSLLATSLLLGSLLSYATGRGLDTHDCRADHFRPRWLGLSLSFLIAALLASPGIFLFFWVWFAIEFVLAKRANEGGQKPELTYFVIGPLSVLVLVAAFSAASGLWWQLQDLNTAPGFAYPFIHALDRFDNSALYPYCALLAVAISLFVRLLTNQLPRTLRANAQLSMILLLVLLSCICNWNRYAALHSRGETLRNIENAVRQHRERMSGNTGRNYVFIANLPQNLSISPRWNAGDLACFNVETGLLSAHPVSADRLLESLTQGQLTNQTLAFDATSNNLSPYIHSAAEMDLLKKKSDSVRAQQTKSVPNVTIAASDKATARAFCAPFYKFPSFPQLGQVQMPDQDSHIECEFDASSIKNAAGIAVEISFPNQPFTAAKANRLSGNEFKLLPFMGTAGRVQLSRADFARPGLYSLRAIAIDSGHTPVGNFSSPMYCLVCQ